MSPPALDAVLLADTTLTALLPDSARNGEGRDQPLYQNNQFLSTMDRMSTILEASPPPGPRHPPRTRPPGPTSPPRHGMRRMAIRVLAPELDSQHYLESLGRGAGIAAGSAAQLRRPPPPTPPDPRPDPLSPQPHLTATLCFFRSWPTSPACAAAPHRRVETLAAVDKTRNNTSLVTKWTYDQTITLLLTGDAELMSWAIMNANGVDFTANLIKVGHHGSINASPTWSFTRVFPQVGAANAVLLSTSHPIHRRERGPRQSVLDGWRARVTSPGRLKRTDRAGLPPGGSTALPIRHLTARTRCRRAVGPVPRGPAIVARGQFSAVVDNRARSLPVNEGAHGWRPPWCCPWLSLGPDLDCCEWHASGTAGRWSGTRWCRWLPARPLG